MDLERPPLNEPIPISRYVVILKNGKVVNGNKAEVVFDTEKSFFISTQDKLESYSTEDVMDLFIEIVGEDK